MARHAGAVSVLEMRLKEAAETGRLINSREALFELEVSANVTRTTMIVLWRSLSLFLVRGVAGRPDA